MDEARNLRVDFANMVGEAYRIYLSGDSKEALKVFVSAARIEMEATRIEKEAEEIFIGLGYYSIDDN